MEEKSLIRQFQTTPKWKEFERWFDQTYKDLVISGCPEVKFEKLTSNSIKDTDIFITLLPFEFLKGVFEKFIESQGYHLCTERRINRNGLVLVPILYKIPEKGDNWTQCIINDSLDTFQELLIWYFNEYNKQI